MASTQQDSMLIDREYVFEEAKTVTGLVPSSSDELLEQQRKYYFGGAVDGTS